jgi:hypothetical protein
MNRLSVSNSKVAQAVKGCVGLLFSSLVVAVVATTVSASQEQYWEGVEIWFFIWLPIGLAYVFLLGAPLLLVGIILRTVRWWSCLLASFLIGFLPTALSDIPHWSALREDFVIGGGLGIIGGLTFWLLWQFWVLRKQPGAGTSPVPE